MINVILVGVVLGILDVTILSIDIHNLLREDCAESLFSRLDARASIENSEIRGETGQNSAITRARSSAEASHRRNGVLARQC